MNIDEIKSVLKEQYKVYYIGTIIYDGDNYVIGEIAKKNKIIYFKLLNDNFLEVDDEKVLKKLKEIAEPKSSNIIY